MLIVTLLVIPNIILEEANLGSPLTEVAIVMNWGIWLAFFFEFVVMLSAAPKKGKWLLKNPLDVAIVFLTPPFLPLNLESARLFRLLRLLRLARMKELAMQVFTVRGLYYAALACGLITVMGGFAFSIVEEGHSTWEGIYWAITTVTTIGSSIEPQTEWGRVLGLVVLFAGTGFVAMLTASFAEKFVMAEQRRKNELTYGETQIVKELQKLKNEVSDLKKGKT